MNSTLISAPAIVLVNPLSGGGTGRRALPQIREVFRTAQLPVEFVETETADALEARAKAEIANGKNLLFVLGGDGTVQAAVNAIFGAEVTLGILPSGGGNDFAQALQLPTDTVAAANAILKRQPIVRAVDLARVRTADGKERLYVGGGGIGIDAEAARHAGGGFRRLPGRLRYVASALRALLSYRSIEVRAEFPESDLPAIEMKSLLAAVLNTPSYGAGIKLAPQAQTDDGWLDFAGVEEMSFLRALQLVPGLLRSGKLPEARVTRVRARRVRLVANRDRFFHGDGELIGCAPVEIEVMPRALRVLVRSEP